MNSVESNQISPPARQLLRYCSFLASKHIPLEIFPLDAASLQSSDAEPQEVFTRAIEELANAELVIYSQTDQTLSIHLEVQECQRADLSLAEQQSLVEQLLISIYQLIISTQISETRLQVYLPHILRLALLSEQWQLVPADAAQVFFWGASALEQQESYREAALLLKRALTLLEAISGADPATLATMTYNLGMLYGQVAEYITAREYLLKALPVLGKLRGRQHPETLLCLNNLGTMYERLDMHEEAEACYRQALAFCGDKARAVPHLTVSIQANLGMLLARREQFAEAEPLLEPASTFYQQSFGSQHASTAEIQRELALVYFKQEKWTQAEALLQQVVLFYEQTRPETLETGKLLLHHAAACLALGRLVLAEGLYERALALHEQKLGRAHAETLLCLEWLALLYAQQGRSDKQIETLAELLERREEFLESTDPQLGETLVRLAEVYLGREQLEQATPLLERALAIYGGPGSPRCLELLPAFEILASASLREGKYEAARLLFERILAIRERALGWEDPGLAAPLNNLAGLAQERNEPDQALAYLTRALAIREMELGVDHPALAALLNNLGNVNMGLGRWQEAEAFFQRALAIQENQPDPDLSLRSSLLDNLATVALAGQDEQRSIELLESALTLHRQEKGNEHPMTIAALLRLAQLHLESERVEQGVELLDQALAATTSGPPVLEQQLVVLDLLASAYRSQGHYQRASELLERALAIRERELGEEHFTTIFTLANQVPLYLALGQTERFTHACALAEERGKWALRATTPEAAMILTLLAELYMLREQFAQARPLLERALELYQNAGTAEGIYAPVQSHLAMIDDLVGDSA